MRAQRNKNAGFTLLEIVLVLVVIMIIAGMVAPRLLGFAHGREASNFAEQLESLARYARQEAIAQSCTIVLNIDPKGQTVWLSREDGPAESPTASPIVSQWGDHQKIPAGVVLTWASMDPNATNNTNAANTGVVRFYSDGRTDPGTLRLKTDDAVILVQCQSATESYRVVNGGA